MACLQHVAYSAGVGTDAGGMPVVGLVFDVGRATPVQAARGCPSLQRRPIGYASGFSSCSSVGTNSLTVGWMCILRDIAV